MEAARDDGIEAIMAEYNTYLAPNWTKFESLEKALEYFRDKGGEGNKWHYHLEEWQDFCTKAVAKIEAHAPA